MKSAIPSEGPIRTSWPALRNLSCANEITKHDGKGEWQTSVQSLPSADAERDNAPTYDLVGSWPTCESLLVNSSNRFLFAAGIT